MAEYRVFWLDECRNTLDYYDISKIDVRAAMATAARRMQQSSHLIPLNCNGFAVVPMEKVLAEEQIAKDAELAELQKHYAELGAKS